MAKYYDHNFNGNKIDVYRVLKIFNITKPAQQHTNTNGDRK